MNCATQTGVVQTIPLEQAGTWLVTTRDGTLLLVASFRDPYDGFRVVTVTRYATDGNGTHPNNQPVMVRPTAAPTVGEPWKVDIIRLFHPVSGSDSAATAFKEAHFETTEVTQIQQLTHELLARLTTNRTGDTS